MSILLFIIYSGLIILNISIPKLTGSFPQELVQIWVRPSFNKKLNETAVESLPIAGIVEHDEVLKFIENRKLVSKGLGYVDIHLLASAILSDSLMWSLDKKLNETAVELNIDFNPLKY